MAEESIALTPITGQGIWNLTGWWQTPAIADGYIASFNNYDGKVYSLGKGQTSTTVEAPMTAVTVGTKMVIQGTYLINHQVHLIHQQFQTKT